MKGILLVLPLLAAGCAGLDPWGELDAAPPAPWAAAPRPAPELQGRALSLAACVGIALERHPAARSSWLAARAAAARVGEERAAFFPEAAFVAEAGRGDTAEFRDEGRSPQDEFRAGFGLRWLLFDGGHRSARVRGAAAELRNATFLHDARLQETVTAVQVAYHERLAAAALAGVADDADRRAATHVELARARQGAGLAARFDVLKAETEKADAALALLRAQSGLRVARGRLAQAMGLRVDEAFEIEDVSEDARAAERREVEELLAEAERSRPELGAARARIEAARAERRAVGAEFLPRLAGFADYGWRDSEILPDRKEWFVGVGVEFPLFGGFSSTYRLDRARTEAQRAGADLEQARREVELEVWTAHARLREAEEAVGAAEALVASAEEGARAAEGMYRAGAGSIIELTDSLTSRTAARAGLIRARLDRQVSLARLERAIGRVWARE